MEIASKSQAENGTDNNTVMTPLRVKQAINASGGSTPLPSNIAYTDQNNHFTQGQMVDGYLTVDGTQWQYGDINVRDGKDIILAPQGPTDTPPTNDTGDIVFNQWRDEGGGAYYEIEKARIWVENSLNNTNYAPSYRAYKNDGTTIVAERKLRTSGIFQARTSNGYFMTWASAWTGEKVNFNDELMNTIGITLNNGDMTIPAGVSQIRLYSRVVMANNQLQGDRGLRVYVNGTWAIGLDYTNSNDLYNTVQGETYLNVNEGDVISIYLTSGVAGTMEIFPESCVMIELV